jgi:hypothetical protein
MSLETFFLSQVTFLNVTGENFYTLTLSGICNAALNTGQFAIVQKKYLTDET